MLIKRTLVAIGLAIVGLPAVILGGLYYEILIILLLGISAWEYGRVFRVAGCNASLPLTVGGVVLLTVARAFFPHLAATVLSLLVLAAMAWHLLDYEKGCNQAGTDFAVTVAGVVYLGWIGAYLIDLRNLPNGMWWLLLVLPAVWLADTAAYFVGKKWGKTPLAPRLSPKKTWEGYWAGVVFGTLGSAGLALLWHQLGGPNVPWWKGALVGLALSTLTTLGDLGESMFKRQAGVKDSSNILPGHGGILDRLDSWLWGAILGYFIVIWFF